MNAWNEKDMARIKAASLSLDELYKTIKDKNVYVAGPYGDSLPFKIRQEHHDGMVKICAHLIESGVRAYAPLAYTHDIAMHGSKPPNGWYEFDLKMLPMFECVLFLLLPGWNESSGMKLEEEAAKSTTCRYIMQKSKSGRIKCWLLPCFDCQRSLQQNSIPKCLEGGKNWP